MTRRSLRHITRYPSLTISIFGLPVVLLLMFVYVFGETLGGGLGPGGGGRSAYANYVTPGILLITLAGGAQGTAISVATDMSTGLMARLRTLPINRAAIMTGHVLGSLLQMMLAVFVVLGVAVATGFRSTATPIEWVAAFGLIVAVTLALTWLSVALGLASKSPETASNSPLILTLLPFLGSGFVPTESMPTGLRWFADHQPFTPLIETLRGLLLGKPIGANWAVGLAWCLVCIALARLWAKSLFERRPTRP